MYEGSVHEADARIEKKKYSIGNEEIPVSAFAAIEPMYTYSNARIKKDPE